MGLVGGGGGGGGARGHQIIIHSRATSWGIAQERGEGGSRKTGQRKVSSRGSANEDVRDRVTFDLTSRGRTGRKT